ncbi:MAG: hypothetical protein V3W14_00920 [Candidatus Neomarinimicrobiota bacterium]
MALVKSIRRYRILLGGISQSLLRNNLGVWPIPGRIQNNESVTRFLGADDIRSSDGTIKHKAFIPPAGISELSVYRIFGLKNPTIWRIGKYLVERYRKKRIIGRADVNVEIIEETVPPLYLKRTYVPHPRHANIKGFPIVPRPNQERNEVIRQTQKQKQKVISFELAKIANPPIRN